MVSCCFFLLITLFVRLSPPSRLVFSATCRHFIFSFVKVRSRHKHLHTHKQSRADTKRRPQQNGKLRSTFVIPIFHFVSLNNKSPRVRHLLHLPIVSVLFIKLHKTCKYKFRDYCQKIEPANCNQTDKEQQRVR